MHVMLAHGAHYPLMSYRYDLFLLRMSYFIFVLFETVGLL